MGMKQYKRGRKSREMSRESDLLTIAGQHIDLQNRDAIISGLEEVIKGYEEENAGLRMQNESLKQKQQRTTKILTIQTVAAVITAIWAIVIVWMQM